MHPFSQAPEDAHADVRRRILILDDHIFFAACLRVLLDNESDLIVCDMLTNSDELQTRVALLKPDLLVIDLALGTENGMDVGRRLRARGIATPILFVSSMAAPSAHELTEIAHAAFIAKSKTPAEFLVALRAVLASGETPTNTLAFSRAAMDTFPSRI